MRKIVMETATFSTGRHEEDEEETTTAAADSARRTPRGGKGGQLEPIYLRVGWGPDGRKRVACACVSRAAAATTQQEPSATIWGRTSCNWRLFLIGKRPLTLIVCPVDDKQTHAQDDVEANLPTPVQVFHIILLFLRGPSDEFCIGEDEN